MSVSQGFVLQLASPGQEAHLRSLHDPDTNMGPQAFLCHPCSPAVWMLHLRMVCKSHAGVLAEASQSKVTGKPLLL